MMSIWSNVRPGSAPGLDCLKAFLASYSALPAQFKGDCGPISSHLISYKVPTPNSRNEGKKGGKEGWREGKKKGRSKETFHILQFFLILFTMPNSQVFWQKLVNICWVTSLMKWKFNAVFHGKTEEVGLINERTFAIFLHGFCPAS